MRGVYSWLIRCAVPFALLAFMRGSESDFGALRRALAEKLGRGKRLTNGGRASRPVWIHAVSLGEMTAAHPFIEALKAQHPDIPLLVTTATRAGRARAESWSKNGIDVRYLPYDTPGAVRRFFERTQPRLGVIMETELWPNLFELCRVKRVPLLIANARLSMRSVSRY